MRKTAVALMLVAALAFLAGVPSGMAQDDQAGSCFELANRTYKLLNAALENERLAHFKKLDHRDSQDNVHKFRAEDFAGDPKASLAEAQAELDAAMELLAQGADKQCLDGELISIVEDNLADAKKLDAFLQHRVAELGGSPADMSAQTYTTFLEKAIELKKDALQRLVAWNFGGQ
jgi:hypothetical protein